MDIQNAVRKMLHKPRRQQPHIAREADQFDAVIFQRGHNFAVVLLARLALRRNDQRIQPALSRSRDPGCIGLVRNNHGDPRVWDAARINAVAIATKFDPRPEKYPQRFHLGNIIIHYGDTVTEKAEERDLEEHG